MVMRANECDFEVKTIAIMARQPLFVRGEPMLKGCENEGADDDTNFQVRDGELRTRRNSGFNA